MRCVSAFQTSEPWPIPMDTLTQSKSFVHRPLIMDVHEDEQHLRNEIVKLETDLASSPNSLPILNRLSDLYLRSAKPATCSATLKQLTNIALNSSIPMIDGLQLADMHLKFWKYERYISKGTLKVNYSKERRELIADMWNVLTKLSASVSTVDDLDNSQIISLKMAYVKECMGNYQDSLSILSDLISSHNVESIELSYVIFKAAIVLKHLGQNKQSIEYLEFLVEDPPVQAGFNKVHILSFLILLYEQSGDKYKVFLPKTYNALVVAYTSETSSDKLSAQVNIKKIQDIIKSPTLSTSSEIWEILALQVLEKCEYIMAVELLQQAIIKAPNKGRLLLILGEIFYLLNKSDQSLKYCEKAVKLLPQNAELRNLLLLLNPDKYADKLRSAPVIHGAVTADDDDGDFGGGGYESNIYDNISTYAGADADVSEPMQEVERNWIDKMKVKATETVNAISNNGLSATIIAEITANPTTTSTTSATASMTTLAAASGTGTGKGGGNTSRSTSATKKRATSPAAAATKPRRPVAASKNTNKVAQRTTTPRVIPVELEQETVFVSTKPKKPVVSAEAEKYMRLVLAGNQNIHFYDPHLATLAKMRSNKNMER